MPDKNLKILYYLAGYIMLMGITGYIRTSAMMPIYLNGAIALITTVLAYFYYKNKLQVVTFVWVILNCFMYTYMTIFGTSAHRNPTVGTYLIFGSMAVFSAIACFQLYKERKF